MKAILLSIKPEWVAKILNGEKTIEVRKLFPKDYVGWVYVYCSKEHNYKDLLIHNTSTNLIFLNKVAAFYKDDWERTPYLQILNGKVVARFWCNKVENVGRWVGNGYGTETIIDTVFNLLTCLRDDQIKEYLGNSKKLFAIHISKLEIFDRPKELGEFSYYIKRANRVCYLMPVYLTKAPQNYCYIEGEENE